MMNNKMILGLGILFTLSACGKELERNIAGGDGNDKNQGTALSCNALSLPLATAVVQGPQDVEMNLSQIFGSDSSLASLMSGRTGLLLQAPIHYPTGHELDMAIQLMNGSIAFDPSGADPVISRFAIQFQFVLRLPQGLEAGRYALALISPDEVKLDVYDTVSKSFKPYLAQAVASENELMSCGDLGNTLDFKKSNEYLVRLQYRHGSASHRGLSLLWKNTESIRSNPALNIQKEGATQSEEMDLDQVDRSCGQGGVHYFYDLNGKQTEVSSQLKARGWSTLPQAAFDSTFTEACE